MILPIVAFFQLGFVISAHAVAIPQWASTFVDDFTKAAESYAKDHNGGNGYDLNDFYSTIGGDDALLFKHLKKSGEADEAAQKITGLLAAGAAKFKHVPGTFSPWGVLQETVPRMIQAGPAPAKVAGLATLAALNWKLRDTVKDKVYNTIGEIGKEKLKQVKLKYNEKSQSMQVDTTDVKDDELAKKLANIEVGVTLSDMVAKARSVLPVEKFSDAKLSAATNDMFSKASAVNLGMTTSEFRAALYNANTVPILVKDLD